MDMKKTTPRVSSFLFFIFSIFYFLTNCLLANAGVFARHGARVLVLNTRGVFLVMTGFLFDRTILPVHQLVVDASMLLGTKEEIILRFDDGNAVKFVERHLTEILFLLSFLTLGMEQNVLHSKELVEERSRILFFAHRALERILGLAQPLLEALFMDRDASLAAATASLHQLAFFFETNVARHGYTWMV